MKKKYILFTLTALLLVVSEKAESQSYRQKDSISSPRIYINAGIYFPQITTNFRIDSDLGLGTEISLEDDRSKSSNANWLSRYDVAQLNSPGLVRSYE